MTSPDPPSDDPPSDGPAPERPVVILDPAPRTLEEMFTADDLARLTTRYECVPADRLDEALPRALAVIGQPPLPAERLARATQLRAVVNVEGNFGPNVDYGYCLSHNIHVLNVGPAFATAVAEMALGLALDLARGITREDRHFRAGAERYLAEATADSILLSGARVGLIGFGNLGRALRPLLEPFRCEVSVYDPWLPDGEIRAHGCRPAPLDDVLGGSDVVFVLAGVTDENQGFLDRSRLERLRPGSRLVVISRAAVVDFDALVDLLVEGRFAAAVDVWPVEPLPADHPARRLAGLDHVVLSPHRAGGIPQALATIGALVLDDLDLVARGLPPVRLQRATWETSSRMRSLPVSRDP
ncbi:MAG TPA: hydroxyacid dehydrogenase, partial [Acidimicrobiales bacterium]|nr:hydroxyacid dehydrogenase [Acidimicrobiales bacterium]